MGRPGFAQLSLPGDLIRQARVETGTRTVKAISLWEPWASLMRTGAKRIETRSWAISYRGPLLICASKHCSKREMRDLLEDHDFQQGLAPLVPGGGPVGLEHLLFGKAVALVDIVGCDRTEDLSEAEIGGDWPFGDYSAGRFGWRTANLRTFDPYPVRGEQGLFEVELPDALAGLLQPAAEEQEPEPAAPMVAEAELVQDYDRPRVINRHHYPGGSSTFPRPWVYIGRGSPLGNPYRRQDHGDAALDLYAKWLWGKVRERDTEVLAALSAIGLKHHLVCSCAPRPCHGDVVVEVAEYLAGKGEL